MSETLFAQDLYVFYHGAKQRHDEGTFSEGDLVVIELYEKNSQLKEENKAWKRCADAFNEATAGVTIGKMAHEHERQLLEAFRQYELLTREGK